MPKENGTSVANGGSRNNECLSKLQLSEEYVLHSAVNVSQQPKLAVSLSNYEILLYDVESKAKVICFKNHKDSVTGIKFSQESPDLLFSSSLDGKILLWDLRKGIQPVKSYCDTSDVSPKPITCFDYNSNERYICGGTEVIREDSFLIFWDKRASKAVGGYWDSHYDEITQVQFHSSHESQLASSSLDGLVNLFDLNEESEDDALQNTLNVGSSVSRFCWGTSDVVSCTTSTEEYQFWSTSQVKPSVSMSKKQLSEDFLCDVDYLIDTFDVDKSTYLATGTNEGSVQLYSCSIKGLKIIREFKDGHTDTVRTISHSNNRDFFVTGGEDGVICIWKSPL